MASTAKRRPVNDAIDPVTFNTASVLDGALMVQDSSNDYAVTQSANASPTEATETFIGLAKTSGATVSSGNVFEVVESGIYPGIAGNSITRGNWLTSNGDGTLIAISPSSGVNLQVIGRALQSASTGQRVAVLITVFVMQGH